MLYDDLLKEWKDNVLAPRELLIRNAVAILFKANELNHGDGIKFEQTIAKTVHADFLEKVKKVVAGDLDIRIACCPIPDWLALKISKETQEVLTSDKKLPLWIPELKTVIEKRFLDMVCVEQCQLLGKTGEIHIPSEQQSLNAGPATETLKPCRWVMWDQDKNTTILKSKTPVGMSVPNVKIMKDLYQQGVAHQWLNCLTTILKEIEKGKIHLAS